MVALSKSQNKHNHLYVKAMPLSDEVTKDIKTSKINAHDNFKAHARILTDEHGWDATDAKKTWCFGPETTGPNLLVNVTKGVQYLNEIKDYCVAAFQWATKEGVHARTCAASISTLWMSWYVIMGLSSPFSYFLICSFTLMQSTVVEEKSYLCAVVSVILLICWLPLVSKSPYTLVHQLSGFSLHLHLHSTCGGSSITRKHHGWYLQCIEQAPSSCFQQGTMSGDTHVDHQSIPSSHGVLWFQWQSLHCNQWTSLPSEHI